MAQEINSSDDLLIYNNNKHLRIFAGPGAGKTHLLVENIKLMVQNSLKLKSSFRKVLCITYTNNAADQIRSRLGTYNNKVIVSTIHSFINEYVIKPNQLQLRNIIKEEFGMTITNNKLITSVNEGFSVLSGHSKDDIFEHLEKKHPEIIKDQYTGLSRSKMSDTQIDISVINNEKLTSDHKAELKLDKKILPSVAMAIKKYIWNEANKLTFDEVLYFGYKILYQYNLAAHLIRCEFPYLLIDEYQDTNPIQNKIIRLISEKECIVAVIGDMAQSIYSFQGANYKEFQNFTLSSKLPIQDYVIKGNRRSTRNIIHLINFLRKNDHNLSSQTCELNFTSNQLVTFLIQKDRKSFSIPLEEVIPQNTVILCRKWAEAINYITSITNEQRKLVNDIFNGYTYQLHRSFENELQARKEAWIESMVVITELEEAHRRKCVPSALKIFEQYLFISPLLRDFNEEKNKVLQQVIVLWEKINQSISETKLLKDLVFRINDIMRESNLNIKNFFRYPLEGEEEHFEAIYKYVDKLEYSTAKKITKEVFVSDGNKYMTIHKAKGAEYDNVLVNIEPTRMDSKQCVPLNVICNPMIFSNSYNETDDKYEEFTRIVYVGASRAKNKLFIHLYGDEQSERDIEQVLDKFCKEIGEERFYDFVYC
jgi:DNA helicase II / ATP-dependent DNA helicase PcrA